MGKGISDKNGCFKGNGGTRRSPEDIEITQEPLWKSIHKFMGKGMRTCVIEFEKAYGMEGGVNESSFMKKKKRNIYELRTIYNTLSLR